MNIAVIHLYSIKEQLKYILRSIGIEFYFLAYLFERKVLITVVFAWTASLSFNKKTFNFTTR